MTLGVVESGGGVVDSGGTVGKLQDSSLYELSGGSTRDYTMGEVILGVSASTGVSIADSGVMAARNLSFGAATVGVYDLRGWSTVDPTIAGVITGDSSSRVGSAADSGGRGGKLVSDSSGGRGGMVAGSPYSRGQTANFWVFFLRGGPDDHDASASIARKWSLLTSFGGGKEKNQRHNGSPERNGDPDSSAACNSGSNWSLLPLEFLCLIAVTTRDMGDYINFQLACKNWQKATKDCKLQGQLPMIPLWLGQDDISPCFCNMFTDRVYRVCIPEMANGCYVDLTAHGWIMLSDKSFNLFLFNQFGESLINLSPVMPFIRLDRLDYYTYSSAGNSYRFRIGAEFAVALVSRSDLIYLRHGINYWIRVAHVSEATIERLTSHFNRFYVVY